MAWIRAAAATPFGRHEGSDSLDLMSQAAAQALRESGLERTEIGGVICGHSTTLPHLMLATVFAEHFGLQPRYAHGVQHGGATGLAMVMLADALVAAGVVEHVLVVAGENRLTGQSRDTTLQSLAQVGHPRYELPLGLNVPAYYALLASRYLHEYRRTEEDLAELAVLMRRHALDHPQAHFHQALSVADVMASKPIATPLKLLDCSPVSDGGAAVIVSKAAGGASASRISGGGQAHMHQHATAAADLIASGAREAAERALSAAGTTLAAVDYLGIYDSFTVTLAVLLEQIGLCRPGHAAADVRSGRFNRDGPLPLNTHGGLLSYGHCGAAGSLGHLVEAHLQLTGAAGVRQVAGASRALVHGDGGIMSSHVSLVLEAQQ